jgi:hypothetical protein
MYTQSRNMSADAVAALPPHVIMAQKRMCATLPAPCGIDSTLSMTRGLGLGPRGVALTGSSSSSLIPLVSAPAVDGSSRGMLITGAARQQWCTAAAEQRKGRAGAEKGLNEYVLVMQTCVKPISGIGLVRPDDHSLQLM